MPTFQSVLDFWFGPLETRAAARPEWFRKDPAFDGEIARRFGSLHRAASRRELEAWRMSAQPMLALVVLLDQFSRNLYRDDARAFAQDAHARECSREALERGDDLALLPVERQFLYLPFVHGEDAADQDRGVELMRSLESFGPTRCTSWSRAASWPPAGRNWPTRSRRPVTALSCRPNWRTPIRYRAASLTRSPIPSPDGLVR